MKFRYLILALVLLGCRTTPISVPVASVRYDGFKEGNEIITTLKAHGIPSAWEGEATVEFPILVPKNKFENAVAILRTNQLVASEKVRLYPTITREVKGP